MPMPRTPLLTVDCVVVDKGGRLLLVRRKHAPFQDALALPGGFVEVGETVEDACKRELREETNLNIFRLRLVGVYSAPDRDPRGHTCSVAFLARTRKTAVARAGDDATAVNWIKDWRRTDLAFDHRRIIGDAMRLLERIRNE
jgi:8-oxo-dGTP diphosphatase